MPRHTYLFAKPMALAVPVLWSLLLVAYGAQCENPGCDNEAAGPQTQACEEGLVECEGIPKGNCKTVLDDMGNIVYYANQVMEDFPKSCVQQADANCNMPGKKCHQPVSCRYEDLKCVLGFVSGNWSKAQKRTTCECQPGM